jgi:hypothetical protein
MKSRRVACNAVLALGTTQTLIRGLLAREDPVQLGGDLLQPVLLARGGLLRRPRCVAESWSQGCGFLARSRGWKVSAARQDNAKQLPSLPF